MAEQRVTGQHVTGQHVTEQIFTEIFGRPPHLVRWAPGRVNIIGEHLDYNDGHVLPIAVPLRIDVHVARRADASLHIASTRRPDSQTVVVELADLAPGAVDGWPAYVAGTVWALRQAGSDVAGADILVDADLPSGAGMSSSAALECATALALLDLWEVPRPAPLDIARLAQRAENDFVGVPCGLLDQAASMLCEAGHALLLDCRDLSRRHVPLDLGGAGLVLLVVDTRVQHDLADGEYALRRAECSRAAAELGVAALRDVVGDDLDATLGRLSDDLVRRRVRHVVTEERRVHDVVSRLDGGDIGSIGMLLTASHASLRDDYEVSCAELDLAVDTACGAGALGARMTGGGFGGSAIALVAARDARAVTAAVETAFADSGLRAPVCREFVEAAPGAATALP